MTATLPAETAIDRTVIRVPDPQRVAEFYAEVIGLETLESNEGPTVLGAGGHPIVELTHDATAESNDPRAAGLYHHAIRVPDRAALGDVLERIRGHTALDGASDHGFSEALYLRDPAGNGVECYADRPLEEWPRDPDGGIALHPPRPLDLDDVAAEASGGDGVPPSTDMGHVHLAVTDLDAARTFYVDVLGFEETMATSGARFVAVDGYHHHVAMNTWEGRSERFAEGPGLERFEISVPDSEAIEAVRDRVESGTVGELREAGDGWLDLADPDGIGVRVGAGEGANNATLK